MTWTTSEPGELLCSAWKSTCEVGGVEVEGLGGFGLMIGADR